MRLNSSHYRLHQMTFLYVQNAIQCRFSVVRCKISCLSHVPYITESAIAATSHFLRRKIIVFTSRKFQHYIIHSQSPEKGFAKVDEIFGCTFLTCLMLWCWSLVDCGYFEQHNCTAKSEAQGDKDKLSKKKASSLVRDEKSCDLISNVIQITHSHRRESN